MCSEYLTKAIQAVQMAREDIANAHKHATPLEAMLLSTALTNATELYGHLLRIEEAVDAQDSTSVSK